MGLPAEAQKVMLLTDRPCQSPESQRIVTSAKQTDASGAGIGRLARFASAAVDQLPDALSQTLGAGVVNSGRAATVSQNLRTTTHSLTLIWTSLHSNSCEPQLRGSFSFVVFPLRRSLPGCL